MNTIISVELTTKDTALKCMGMISDVLGSDKLQQNDIKALSIATANRGADYETLSNLLKELIRRETEFQNYKLAEDLNLILQDLAVILANDRAVGMVAEQLALTYDNNS